MSYLNHLFVLKGMSKFSRSRNRNLLHYNAESSKKKSYCFNLTLVTVSLVLLFFTLSCNKDSYQQDAFIQKWRSIAQQSQGHSESQTTVPIDVDERNLKLEEGYPDISKLLEEPEAERPLPKTLITIDMRKAPISSVLLALAKAVDLPMVISSSIGKGSTIGEPKDFSNENKFTRKIVNGNETSESIQVGSPVHVSINVSKKPWDEIFKSVIKTYGLAYSWEGDILRVKTLEDIKHEVELTSLKAKSMVQKALLMKAEPPITRMIKIRYVSVGTIEAMINKIVFNQDTKLSDEGGEQKQISESITMQSMEDTQKVETETTTKDAGGEASEMSNQVPGYVFSEKETNSLIVQAPRPMMKVIYYLVRKVDKPRRQIKIKAYIVEADQRTARELGIQWGGIYQYQHAGNTDKFVWMPGGTGGNVQTYQGAGGGPQTGLYTPDYGRGASGQGWASSFPLSLTEAATRGSSLGFMFGTIGENILEAQLQALALGQKVNILSSPSLTTLDNEIATIADGEEVPYVTGYNDNGNPSIAWKEAVLSLSIKPLIVGDNQLKMHIQIKKDELDFTRSIVQGIPVVRKKWAENRLIVRDGETVVIGGLVRKRADKSNDGIPYLKDIPVLGWVFKRDLKDETQSEILIFITPQILDYWKPGEEQKSFDQIDRELREDGLVHEIGNESIIQSQ